MRKSPGQARILTCLNCHKPFRAVASVIGKRKHCSQACYFAYRYSMEHLLERFWGQVKKTPSCWLWEGFVLDTGYGQTYWPGRGKMRPHRISYILANGEIPEGLDVLHKCDTPLCVRPEHLFLGNDADNCADKVAKLRHLFCERAARAKLTNEQVLAIRREHVLIHRRKSNQQELARKYGVSASAINAIVTGRAWKRLGN